jgi:hypothetical protein
MTLIDYGAVIRILLDGRISSLCSLDDLLGKFATLNPPNNKVEDRGWQDTLEKRGPIEWQAGK